ncbi:MAG: DMT family transporter [Burkholderiaceae bacterium]
MSSHAPTATPAFATRHPRFPEAILVFITMIWGATFLLLQFALQWTEPFHLVAMRFGLAALFFALYLRGRALHITRTEWVAGSLIGVSLFLGYTLQTAGLQFIPSSTSAFLTALYVPFVPLLQFLFLRHKPHAAAWVGIALAFGGMILLANPFELSLANGTGEWLTVVSAVAIAAEILLVSHYARHCNPARLTLVQMSVVAVLATAGATLSGEAAPRFTPGLLVSITALAAALAFIQLAINWAQRTVSATRATLIYALEPVWAGVFGRIAGERLGPLGLLGGALIVLAVGVSEWRPRRGRPR